VFIDVVGLVVFFMSASVSRIESVFVMISWESCSWEVLSGSASSVWVCLIDRVPDPTFARTSCGSFSNCR